jgi:hypothetical protein
LPPTRSISAVRSALEQPKKPPVTPVQSVLSMTRFRVRHGDTPGVRPLHMECRKYRQGKAIHRRESGHRQYRLVRSALEQPKKPPVTPVQSVLSMTRFPSMNSFALPVMATSYWEDSLVYLFSDGDVPESLIGKPYSYIASISAVRSALEQPKKPPVTPVQSVLSMTRFPSMNMGGLIGLSLQRRRCP